MVAASLDQIRGHSFPRTALITHNFLCTVRAAIPEQSSIHMHLHSHTGWGGVVVVVWWWVVWL
jgi:hypothetical protein